MPGVAFDEMGKGPQARSQYAQIRDWLSATPVDLLVQKRHEAEYVFRRTGITFAVYTEGGDPDRLIPFDIIPRLLDANEWAQLARGLEQRVRALNAFPRDTYGPREFVRAGRIPEALIPQNPDFEAAMQGLAVAGGV